MKRQNRISILSFLLVTMLSGVVQAGGGGMAREIILFKCPGKTFVTLLNLTENGDLILYSGNSESNPKSVVDNANGSRIEFEGTVADGKVNPPTVFRAIFESRFNGPPGTPGTLKILNTRTTLSCTSTGEKF